MSTNDENLVMIRPVATTRSLNVPNISGSTGPLLAKMVVVVQENSKAVAYLFVQLPRHCHVVNKQDGRRSWFKWPR